MSFETSFLPAPPVLDGAQPLDGLALRRDLSALARSSGGDNAALRKAALATIRAAFLAAREKVKAGMESGVSPGLSVARALSARTLRNACWHMTLMSYVSTTSSLVLPRTLPISRATKVFA